MNRPIKRVMDVVLAAAGLILGAPLIALIALAVRLDSPGRAIFSQERLGLHGKVFRMYKFRKFPAAWGDRGAGVTVAGDARMTRLGRFLERSKFDEIPQLWNILKGEMSFVGPRPETLRFKDLFEGELARVHDFLPGIFGPNQIAFRNESKMYPPDRDPEQFYREELFPRKARNDIAYFSQSNAFSDFRWILRGLWYSVAGAVDWRAQARLRGRVLLLDLLLIQIAWIGANLVRFEEVPVGQHWDVFLTGTWLMPLVVLPVLALGGGYRGAVRHFTAGDAVRLGVSNLVGWTLAFLLLLALFERNAAMGLMPMALLFAVATMVTARILYRERCRRRVPGSDAPGVRLAVYGTGQRGVALAALLAQGFPRATVVGFLDDNDAEMRGRMVGERPVLGSERDLDTVHAVHKINQIWMTFEPEAHKRIRLTDWTKEHDVRLVVLPEIQPFLTLTERRRNPALPRPDRTSPLSSPLKT
jgi:lipopolysaccharide/colanic/teichoic acid biosynthesis glycosyltransferase